MSTKPQALLAALLLAALALSAAPSFAAPRATAPANPTTPAASDPNLFGMVIRDPWYEFGTHPRYPGEPNYEAQLRMGQILAEAGVRRVRVEFIVRDGAGTWQEQVARNDYFITQVAPQYGLQVMALLGFALVDIDPRDPQNGLVAGVSTDPVYGGGVNPWMKSWLDRALYVAQRYEGKLTAIEVLNEQNRLPPVPATGGHIGFAGAEGIDPTITARLHTKFYRCFKQRQCGFAPADPQWPAAVTVVLGGLHPRGSDSILPRPPVGQPQRLNDRDYLARIYTSEPFASYFAGAKAYPVDGLGYHPYPAEIQTTLAEVDSEVARITGRLDEVRAKLRDTLKATAPAAAEVPFWITEIGYNAGYLRQTAAGQAAFLRGVFATLGARGDVATIFWFKYEDFPPASGPNAQLWGIVQVPFTVNPKCPGGACYDPSGEPAFRRASYFAYRELAGLPVQHISLPVIQR
jgi:hypothetical protein